MRVKKRKHSTKQKRIETSRAKQRRHKGGTKIKLRKYATRSRHDNTQQKYEEL